MFKIQCVTTSFKDIGFTMPLRYAFLRLKRSTNFDERRLEAPDVAFPPEDSVLLDVDYDSDLAPFYRSLHHYADHLVLDEDAYCLQWNILKEKPHTVSSFVPDRWLYVSPLQLKDEDVPCTFWLGRQQEDALMELEQKAEEEKRSRCRKRKKNLDDDDDAVPPPKRRQLCIEDTKATKKKPPIAPLPNEADDSSDDPADGSQAPPSARSSVSSKHGGRFPVFSYRLRVVGRAGRFGWGLISYGFSITFESFLLCFFDSLFTGEAVYQRRNVCHNQCK